MPCAAAQGSRFSHSGTTSMLGNGRRSPMITACDTNGDITATFSMGCGATFLPPAVTMMFFSRSVMRRKPSGVSSPMSPVWNQPSASITSRVASSLRQ